MGLCIENIKYCIISAKVISEILLQNLWVLIFRWIHYKMINWSHIFVTICIMVEFDQLMVLEFRFYICNVVSPKLTKIEEFEQNEK